MLRWTTSGRRRCRLSDVAQNAVLDGQLQGRRRGQRLCLYNSSRGKSGGKCEPETTPRRRGEGTEAGCSVRAGGRGRGAAVEGLQQKTFQETRRHNLLIRGRLVQRTMCGACTCPCAGATFAHGGIGGGGYVCPPERPLLLPVTFVLQSSFRRPFDPNLLCPLLHTLAI